MCREDANGRIHNKNRLMDHHQAETTTTTTPTTAAATTSALLLRRHKGEESTSTTTSTTMLRSHSTPNNKHEMSFANKLFQRGRSKHSFRREVWMILPLALLLCSMAGLMMQLSAMSYDTTNNTYFLPTILQHQEQGLVFPCTTKKCQRRLEELESKLSLEETLYQQIYTKEKHRTEKMIQKDKEKPFSMTRHDIIQERILEVKKNALEVDGGKHRYLPPSKWTHKSYPEINVVGNLKTGTSQLYNIFNTHRDVHRIKDDEKEHCAMDDLSEEKVSQSTQEYGLHTWHSYYYSHYDEKDHRPRVNGCVAWSQVEKQIAYRPPSPNAKFFIILRDPADWTWAAYNFWKDHAWDDWDDDGNWVQDKKDYRSPEAFHEVILSGGKLKAYEGLMELRDESVTILRRMQALVGKENLIVLRNEDLVPGRVNLAGGVLDKLSNATGLAKDGFDDAVLSSRSNCNAHKGYGSKACTEKSHQSGGYPVTHNRPMLDATRSFIYLQWHAECRIWAAEFGIVYPECLDAIALESETPTTTESS